MPASQRTVGRQLAGGTTVGRQLSGGPVAGDATGGQDVGWQRVGEVPGRRCVVDGPVAPHVQQRGGSRPSGGRHDQVGIQRPSVADRDLRDTATALDRHDGLAPAGIQDGDDLHADPFQVGHRGVTIGVGTQDHGPVPGPDRPHVDESTNRSGEHDAGGVVAGEHVRTLDQSGGHDQYAGPCLDEALGGDGVAPLHDGDPVVVVATGHRGVDEHLDAGVCPAGGCQLGSLRPLVVVTP